MSIIISKGFRLKNRIISSYYVNLRSVNTFAVESRNNIANQDENGDINPPQQKIFVNGPSNELSKLNFYNFSEQELAALLTSWKQPKFRTDQIRKAVYEHGITDFQSISDIPNDLRRRLSEIFAIGTLKLISEQVSKDGTKKRAYELDDGQIIESVLMPYDDGRYTACISSQAGCAMGCVFCATGQMGFSRQLTSAEIFEQAQRFSTELKSIGKRLSNIVFMGKISTSTTK